MKHYNLNMKCAYIMKHIFAAPIGKHHQTSIYTFRKHLSKPEQAIEKLIEDGYISIIQKGTFRESATIYKKLKEYTECIDISHLEEDVETKRIRNRNKMICAENLFVDISDSDFISASPQQQRLIKNINTCNIITHQSANKTIWSDFASLKKEYREMIKTRDTKSKLVEIDINASIPRLLSTFFKNHTKNWLDVFRDQIVLDVEKYEDAIKKHDDAYAGLIEIMRLEISRDDFKNFFLKMLFGAGTKDGKHKHEIKEAFTKEFPGMSQQLGKFANDYRMKKKSAATSWKITKFAGQIFSLQARIIEKVLAGLDCEKFSVFDSVYCSKDEVSKAEKLLRDAWTNITGASALLGFRVNGRFAPVPSGTLPFCCNDSKINDSKIKTATVKREGEGLYHINGGFEFNDSKTIVKNEQEQRDMSEANIPKGDRMKTKDDINVRKVMNNGSEAWIYRGTSKQIMKSCRKIKTEDSFKEYVLNIINNDSKSHFGILEQPISTKSIMPPLRQSDEPKETINAEPIIPKKPRIKFNLNPLPNIVIKPKNQAGFGKIKPLDEKLQTLLGYEDGDNE